MSKLNILSLLYIACSLTISLAAFCVPSHIAEIAIMTATRQSCDESGVLLSPNLKKSL